MRPEPWNPPINLSEKEAKIVNTSIGYAGETPAPLSVKLIKRAKLFTFLREVRHLLFDQKFQEELSKMYAEAVTGHPPVPPAQKRLNRNLTSLYQGFRCRSHRSSDNGSAVAVSSQLS